VKKVKTSEDRPSSASSRSPAGPTTRRRAEDAGFLEDTETMWRQKLARFTSTSGAPRGRKGRGTRRRHANTRGDASTNPVVPTRPVTQSTGLRGVRKLRKLRVVLPRRVGLAPVRTGIAKRSGIFRGKFQGKKTLSRTKTTCSGCVSDGEIMSRRPLTGLRR